MKKYLLIILVFLWVCILPANSAEYSKFIGSTKDGVISFYAGPEYGGFVILIKIDWSKLDCDSIILKKACYVYSSVNYCYTTERWFDRNWSDDKVPIDFFNVEKALPKERGMLSTPPDKPGLSDIVYEKKKYTKKKLSGDWEDGKLKNIHGNVKIKEWMGTYTGNVKVNPNGNIVKHGQGTMKWNNGCSFTGEWRDNNQYNGTYYYPNGEYATYQYGRITRDTNQERQVRERQERQDREQRELQQTLQALNQFNQSLQSIGRGGRSYSPSYGTSSGYTGGGKTLYVLQVWHGGRWCLGAASYDVSHVNSEKSRYQGHGYKTQIINKWVNTPEEGAAYIRNMPTIK